MSSFDTFLAAVRERDDELAASELNSMDISDITALDGYLGRCRSRVAQEITLRAIRQRRK